MLPPQPSQIPALYQQALTALQAGQPEDARALLQQILLARPTAPEVLFQLGRAETLLGHKSEAEAALRQALKAKPAEPAIWQALHAVLQGSAAKRLEREAAKARVVLGSEADLRPILALIDKGQAEEAEARALGLVKAAPTAFWPAYGLGAARAAQSKWGGALGPLEKAHERDPAHAPTQLALGRCLLELDRPGRAEAVLSPIAAKSTAARVTLAEVYARTLRLSQAAELLLGDGFSKKRPADLYVRLAEVEARRASEQKAFEAADWALRRGAKPGALYGRLARAFEECGRIEAAHRALDLGVKAAPKLPALLTQKAQSLQSEGQMQEAQALLAEVRAAHPDHAEAYRATVAATKLGADAPLLAEIETQLARPDLTRANRRIFHFAAAKAMADQGEWAAEFDHLKTANRLMSDEFPYGFQADLEDAKRLVADWDRLAPMTADDAPHTPVLFVSGLPRSGTTLVETILSAHPQVAAGGEMRFLAPALMPVFEGLRAGGLTPHVLGQAGQRYVEAAQRRTGSDVFTDKAISSFSRVGHLARVLPKARFFILDRDPRDVGLSMYRNMFPEGLHRYTTDLNAMGRYIRLHDALVDFWVTALPDRVMRVDYQALTAAPEENIRKIVAFAGLPWDPACLAPEKSTRRVETLSFAQVRAPIGQHAVAGWRRHEAALQPLIEALENTQIDLSS